MKPIEFINGLENGTITILGGHNFNMKRFINERKFDHEFNVEMFEKYTNNTEKTEQDEKMAKLYKLFMERDYEVGLQMKGYIECRDCGKTVWPFCMGDNTVFFGPMELFNKKKEIETEDKVRMTLNDVIECETKELKSIGKITARINVPSGKLVIQNFFSSEEMMEHFDSVESIQGRYNITKHLESKNIGYGQMTNTSIDIYHNKEEILFTTFNIDEIINYEIPHFKNNPEELTEYTAKINSGTESFYKTIQEGNFKRAGYVSLDMWRWMCADITVLEEYKEDPDESAVIIDIEPGVYEIDHYFDFFPKDDPDIISTRIKKVE